jgi:hypothetical protein
MTKSNIMKKILVAGLSVLLLSASQSQAQAPVNVKVKVKTSNEGRDDDGWTNFSGRHVPGTWIAYIENEKVYIQFTGEDWDTGRSFLLSELGTPPNGNEGTFKVTREAGTVTFKGIFAAGKGHGFYTFAENPTFKSYLEQKSYSGLNKQLMLDIFFTDINKSYFEFLKVNGYATVSNEQLKDLAQQDLSRKVMEDYFSLFKTESWGHPSLNKIVELREHGVNARFVNSFHQMGYKENIPLDKALELRDHGVSPEFITSIQKMGYEKISLDKAVELQDHGVNPEFIYSMQKMGYKGVTLDRAQELIDHGVNTNFIKSIYALGFKDLTLDKAQELIDHGVTADFIKKMRNKGVKVQTLDEYIRLQDTGFNE